MKAQVNPFKEGLQNSKLAEFSKFSRKSFSLEMSYTIRFFKRK